MRISLILPTLALACTDSDPKNTGNTAPEFVSLSIVGDNYSTSATLTCEAVYSDINDDIVTLEYEWTNQRGEVLGTNNIIELQPGLVAPEELLNCQATISDGQASVSEITSVTIENTNPTVDDVSIDPSNGITPESTLTCTATASDVDGGSPSISYKWSRDGQSLASTNTLSLPIVGNVEMGDEFVCTATALDEHGGEGVNTGSVIVGNSAPSIGSVSIVVANNPEYSFTSKLDVQCLAEDIFDLNDDPVTLSYEWTINGAVIANATSDILEAPFTVNDEIGCAVTPNDGFDSGETLSTSILIPNSLPEIFAVDIEPNLDVEANALLTCYVDAFDVDDGQLVGQYEWLDGDGNSAGFGDTLQLDPGLNRPFDDITCIARVGDTNGAQAEFQNNITLINTDPVVDTPAGIAGTSTSTETLVCSAAFSDLNDGSLTPTYAWTLTDGTALSGNADSYTINTTETNPLDEIVCTATVMDLDGATLSSSSSTVIQNTAPVINSFLISPSTSVEANETLQMIHTESDIDDDALTLTYQWVDNTGQVLGNGPSLVLDNARPVGSTVMGTLTVTDAYGASDTISETITILNTDPVVDTPANISANPSVTTDATLTCSAIFTDYNDGNLTPSYAWTLSDGTSLPATGNTFVIDASFTNPTDEVICTVSAMDNNGASIESVSSVVIQNTAPVIDSFSVSPSTSVEANETLQMVHTESDQDDDVLTLTYVWTDSIGQVLGSGQTLTLDNSRPVGSTVTAMLTVTDAYGASDTVSETITILNTDPVVDTPANISANPSVTTDATLTCSAIFTDYNDGNLTPSFVWSLSSGSVLANSGNTYTVNDAMTNPGDTIVCTASATDNNGANISSTASTVLQNTDPTVDSFTITPGSSVEANETLEIVSSYSDIDNQGLTPAYEWRNAQGILLGSSNILPLNSGYDVGSVLTGTITVTDVNGASISESGTVEILNTAPTVSNPASISASPSAITTGILTCISGFSDFNDGVLSPVYAWSLSNGTPLPATGNSLTIDASTTNPNDTVVCSATATDSDGASISSNASIQIQNTAPSIDSFTITPGTSVEANVTVEMTLSVSDLDDDTLSIGYIWTNSSGQTLGTGSALTLDNSYSVGSTLTAIATLTDAYGATDTATQNVTILNTDPQLVSAAAITTSTGAVTNGILNCSASFTDFNDGALTPTYTWSNAGTTIGTGSSYTISSSDASPGDLITCTATASDINGASIVSNASILVQNTAPVVNSVSIAPTPAYNNSTISCSFSASDIDSGESQIAGYAWTRNGTSAGGSSSTYGGALSVGDVIGCTVTLTDNFGGSDTASSTVTIANRSPSVTSIVLPTTVDSQTDITAVVTANDPDGQTVSFSYAWFKVDDSAGGTVVSVGSDSPTLPASQFDKHDEIYVTVTPSDASSSGSPSTSTTTTVINTVPTTPSVTLSPSSTNIVVGADLTCTVTTPSQDIDGDSITYHFEWFNPSNGLESETYTSSTTDIYLGSNVDAVGTWTCRVTPEDDDGAGTSASDTTSALGLDSCKDYSDAGATQDGLYTLYIGGNSVSAYCDMTTDGGGWTLFGITSSSQCAENLPYGPNTITSTSGSAYLTTLFKDVSHDEFMQDFRANGSTTTFKIIYTFGSGSKTVRQRFDSAVASGESVSWSVYFANTLYSYSGTWRFSNSASTSSKWNGSGSNFSNDDGIWGAQTGTLDGNSPGPYLGTSGWGHQNRNGGDSACANYYYAGTSSSSSSIKNLMYFR